MAAHYRHLLSIEGCRVGGEQDIASFTTFLGELVKDNMAGKPGPIVANEWIAFDYATNAGLSRFFGQLNRGQYPGAKAAFRDKYG